MEIYQFKQIVLIEPIFSLIQLHFNPGKATDHETVFVRGVEIAARWHCRPIFKKYCFQAEIFNLPHFKQFFFFQNSRS